MSERENELLMRVNELVSYQWAKMSYNLKSNREPSQNCENEQSL
jgi:hypothetical protein